MMTAIRPVRCSPPCSAGLAWQALQSTPSMRRVVRGSTRSPMPLSKTGLGAWQSMQFLLANSLESVRTAGFWKENACWELSHSAYTSSWQARQSRELVKLTALVVASVGAKSA